MANSRMEQWVEGAALLVFVVLCMGPSLALILDFLETGWGLPIFSVRQLGLLGNTIAYAAVSAWGAMILGIVIAVFLWSYPGWLARLIKVLMLLMLPMPAFVHAAGWRGAWRILNDQLGFDISGQGWIAAAAITILAFLPVAVGAAWLGLQAVDRDLIGSGRIFKPDINVLQEIILPLAAPFLAAGGAAIMVLSMLDYTIPSLCQVNVYALEIFADFSAGNSPGGAFMLALPMIIVNSIIVGWLMSSLRKAGLSGIRTGQSQTRMFWPVWFWCLLGAGVLALALQAGTPLITLAITAISGDTLWRQLGFTSEMGYSMATALGIGLAAVLIAYPVARVMTRRTGKYLWPLLMLPMVMPASLTGIGLIKMGSVLPYFSGSDIMPVIAGLARFLPLAVLVIWAGLQRLDPLLIEAGRMMQVKEVQSLLKVEIPLIAPVLFASFLFLFALGFGELGATLMVAPPGRSTLTVTIYNYLHYGASGSVSALCIFTAALCCMVWGGGLKIFQSIRRLRWN